MDKSSKFSVKHGLGEKDGEHRSSEERAQLRWNTETCCGLDSERGTVEVHMKGIVHTIGPAETIGNRNDLGWILDVDEPSDSMCDGERRE